METGSTDAILQMYKERCWVLRCEYRRNPTWPILLAERTRPCLLALSQPCLRLVKALCLISWLPFLSLEISTRTLFILLAAPNKICLHITSFPEWIYSWLFFMQNNSRDYSMRLRVWRSWRRGWAAWSFVGQPGHGRGGTVRSLPTQSRCGSMALSVSLRQALHNSWRQASEGGFASLPLLTQNGVVKPTRAFQVYTAVLSASWREQTPTLTGPSAAALRMRTTARRLLATAAALAPPGGAAWRREPAGRGGRRLRSVWGGPPRRPGRGWRGGVGWAVVLKELWRIGRKVVFRRIQEGTGVI